MKDLASEVLEEAQAGGDTDLIDASQALGNAIDAEAAECERGEQTWNPAVPDADVVAYVACRPTDLPVAREIQNAVRGPISFLRNQLRARFLQARKPHTRHGVRKGSGLSPRRLVNSFVEISGGRRASRPDYRKVCKDDCSLAVALVIDQSGSMSNLRMQVAKAAVAISSALDQVGSPCLVVGPRGSWGSRHNKTVDLADYTRPDGSERFHRSSGITIDVFKDWHESLAAVLPRFARVQATGTTPLSDGIQYAMQELNTRPERHRVVMVITDGEPNCENVVRRQVRLAQEAGVQIIGVGIDQGGCAAVPALFPTHVLAPDVEGLPTMLLGVLTSIVFPKHGGKRIQLVRTLRR